jgi:hypothetical protein
LTDLIDKASRIESNSVGMTGFCGGSLVAFSYDRLSEKGAPKTV